jgi:formate dehydrogenase iron-sulfur subunit
MLYDPAGVGGTGVVTVLAHGDKPELYGLPKDPRIPAAVGLSKLILKPLGIFAIGATLVGLFTHYLRVGPKKPHDDTPPKAGG